MNKAVNKLIPDALEAVRDILAKQPGKFEVDKEYKGYVASLGASIVQSGLLPALSFYTDVSEVHGNKLTPDQRKNKLLQAILFVVDKQAYSSQSQLLKYVIEKISANPSFKANDPNSNFTDFWSDRNKERIITRRIINASLAIKLALRAFKYTQG